MSEGKSFRIRAPATVKARRPRSKYRVSRKFLRTDYSLNVY